MTIKGHATESATKAYADRMWKNNPKISPNAWRIMEGLTIGKVGFGSYRINGTANQAEALEKALLSGVNLIDTAPNYMDGDAETTIGEVLSKLTKSSKISREEVVLVTKAGYIQGVDLLGLAAEGTQYPDTIEIAPHTHHCIHPTFIARQLEQSLNRMNVDTIDAVLVHNPEYFLGYEAAQAGGDISTEVQEEFYRRIEDAFTYLEGQVKEGKINCYGLSSNTLVAPKSQPDHVDLARVFQAAQAAAQTAWGRKKRPAFRVLEMPINILELGAIHTKNTTALTFEGSEETTTLELATRMKLTVLANRPLNAFPAEGGAFRLASAQGEVNQQVAERALVDLKETEKALNKVLNGWPSLDDQPMFSFTAHGEELLEHIQNSIQFDHMYTTFLMPHLGTMNQVLEELKQRDSINKDSIDLIQENFVRGFHRLVETIRKDVRISDTVMIEPIEKEVRNRMPEDWRDAPMQQIAITAITSIPGVTCCLCGLREPSYMDDITTIYEKGDFPDVASVIGANQPAEAELQQMMDEIHAEVEAEEQASTTA